MAIRAFRVLERFRLPVGASPSERRCGDWRRPGAVSASPAKAPGEERRQCVQTENGFVFSYYEFGATSSPPGLVIGELTVLGPKLQKHCVILSVLIGQNDASAKS